MNKKARKKMVKGIKSSLEGIFKASANAQPIFYKSGSGQEYKECAGAYSSIMTRAIAHDMTNLALFLYSKDKNIADKAKEASIAVRECDIELRRMFDDLKDNRPIVNFPAKKAYDAIECLADVKSSDYVTEPMIAHYIEKMNVWVDKIAKMNTWAYYCECICEIRETRQEAEMRAYDDDGNQVYGISEKDANAVDALLKMEQILLRALIRISFNDKESDLCMKRIEIVRYLTQAIVKNDTEKLDYLEKCAEAAEEFSHV